MNGLWAAIRKSFFAGLVVVVPVAASVGILWALFTWFTDFLLPLKVRQLLADLPYPETLYRLVALVAFVVLVTVVGWVTRLVIGRRMVALTEYIIARVPLLNRIYAFVKDVSNTMFAGKKSAFQRVVLIEFPRPGSYAIGFVTSETGGEAQVLTKETVVNVFVPTTPNPTSGFLIMVPRQQLIEMQMSVAEGMKLVVSGGSVVPPYVPRTAPPGHAN
jgi:uncharacterized membrane protein